MQALTDEQLRGTAAALRERLAKGETLDDLLPEAFAACREAGWRTKKMRHFDTQMLGGIVLHRGNIAEMVTGEGKTLVATLPAFLNALEGKGVHVVTVNDFLARRDCEWMSPIYKGLGLTASATSKATWTRLIAAKRMTATSPMAPNSEFGFDYLRRQHEGLARYGAIRISTPTITSARSNSITRLIDEVDNILIDEARRTPLIISGQAFSDLRRYAKANEVAVQSNT